MSTQQILSEKAKFQHKLFWSVNPRTHHC